MTEMSKVYEFHQAFDLPVGVDNILFEEGAITDAYMFRLRFLNEELQEFSVAVSSCDRVAALDALIDLVYVAMGTALFMGVSPSQWTESFEAVHRANMTKMRVARPADSKRGSGFDVVKPPGFIPPEHKIRQILGE